MERKLKKASTRRYRNMWWKEAHNKYDNEDDDDDDEADEDDMDILQTSTISSWRQRSVENGFLSTFFDNI
jgi:hypothetical protein